MIKRLVWNFEFATNNVLELAELNSPTEDELKWEARFFWPESEIISLNLIDASLLNLSLYQHKQKVDLYHITKDDHNIKHRRGELFYKPLIQHGKYSNGYGAKLNLNSLNANPVNQPEPGLISILDEVKSNPGIEINKDSFIYKFSIQPSTRLELSRIEINQAIYFSLCVEGKSRHAVEIICKGLIGKKITSDYVGFLKMIQRNNDSSIPYYL